MNPIELTKRECTAIAFQTLMYAVLVAMTNKIDINRMEDLILDQIRQGDSDINYTTFLYNALNYFKSL